VAISPSWDAEGRLFFVRGAATDTDVAADSMHLVVFDPRTGGTAEVMRDASYAEQGTATSEDGKTLLVLRRRLDRPQLEMWTSALDGTDAHALWSYAAFWTVNDPYTRQHAIFQAAAVFNAVAWSR
jgi:hypothetical protein